ncbi:MAG: type CRISPR-associated protein Cas5 [Verrucomicrobiota bacterium]|jgi:CRISPR-associated protein Cas5d
MKSPTYIIRAKGPLAIFTRPEFKSERFSYPCITPSAARGLVEAVLWKPAITWHISKIHILSPIKWTSFRRNEVSSKATAPSRAIIENGGPAPTLHADKDRAMRNTVALKDVDYAIELHFSMTSRAGQGDNVNKFHEMFIRRMAKGQNFQQPYFGCRECIANLELMEEPPEAIGDTKDLGIILWDIDYKESGKDDRSVPIFFHALLESGTITVPANPDEARQSLLKYTIESC